MQKIAILILAAGSSSRMGTAKQLLPYKNSTLLGWTIKNVKETSVKEIFCILGAHAEIIKKSIEKYNIETIYNPNFSKGLSSSIVAGIDHLKAENFDSVLIMLVDQPNVDSTYLNELIKASEENPSKVIASNYKVKLGVPAIFPKIHFTQLLNLKGDKGAKELLNKEAFQVIKMKPFNLIDIDTNEDYQNLIN